jgi:hypothetical protein
LSGSDLGQDFRTKTGQDYAVLEEGVEKLVGCQAKKKVECEPVDRPQKKPVNRRILKTGFIFFR